MVSSPGLPLAGGRRAGPLSPGAYPSIPGSAADRGRRIPQGRPALLPGFGTYPGGTRECAPASCGAHGCTPRSFRDGGQRVCVQGQSSTMPGASPRVEGSRLRFMSSSEITHVTLCDFSRKNNFFHLMGKKKWLECASPSQIFTPLVSGKPAGRTKKGFRNPANSLLPLYTHSLKAE